MTRENMTLENSVRICDQVVFRELDGEAVLLHLGTGIYFGLNASGTRIWNLLGQGGSLQSVYEAMRKQYEVPPERLEKDILELMQQLAAKGLVEEHSPTPA